MGPQSVFRLFRLAFSTSLVSLFVYVQLLKILHFFSYNYTYVNFKQKNLTQTQTYPCVVMLLKSSWWDHAWIALLKLKVQVA